ncbi:sensor histidine kinase [Paenibacillus sp. P96]|uniref:Sensor histidine kinase n=1 Tax=Paenibacillus zeirhizosphaerae TaxID=2987519 RepID=A0ABT9FTS0_9BACL|nr:sensor histidine kinase [Paenibacillus sp. P96]MDP4098149.1 sensor histidine kinase [Paenibacillus sp. P96]
MLRRYRIPFRSNPLFALRRLSIKNRLLIAFLITSLLPVVIVALFSNMKYEAAISEKISASSTQILDELTQNASRELEQYETLSETIIMNSLIQTNLPSYATMTDYEKNAMQKRIGDELGEQIFRISNLANVLVLTSSGETFFDLGYDSYSKNLPDMLKAVNDSPGNAYWTYLRTDRGSNRIALSRKIYSEHNLNRQLGYLIILIDEKVFSRNIYRFVDLGEGSRIYISDANGMIVSSVAQDIQQGSFFAKQAVFDRIRSKDLQEGLRPFYADVEGRKTLVTSSYIWAADWYLVGLVPHSFLISELTAMRGSIVLFCLITLFLSGLLAMWIYFSIQSPMRSLLQYAKRIRMGKLETTIGTAYADEMDNLTETINGMVEQLKQLIYQVESEQQAKREAELKMLQAQINPHFMFNTLNSLKWSAMISGHNTVTQGLESLSELLRNTILVTDELIPLDKEIENLQHYATIQRIRYGDSFTLDCEIGSEITTCLVPKFMLQPIVENSILHGGEEDGRRVDIHVSARREGSIMRIRIVDNGKGFDVKEEQTTSSSSAKLSGIGISNVDERIRLHFGSPYHLKTMSEPGKGTETEILLPIRMKEGRECV